jgi:hypothetical protein
MQVCDEVRDLPAECVDQATEHGAVFKVTPSGTCILVGKHDPSSGSELWAPLEDGKPADGIELHYLDGAPCSNMFGDSMGVTTDTGSAPSFASSALGATRAAHACAMTPPVMSQALCPSRRTSVSASSASPR